MKIIFKKFIYPFLLISVFSSAHAEESIISSGIWVEKSYSIKGEWRIVSRDGGRFIIFDENFKTRKGPDLKVYLSTRPIEAIKDRDVDRTSIKIAELQSSRGYQEYEIPADVDLAEYMSILIHCEAFTHLWGGAPLH